MTDQTALPPPVTDVPASVPSVPAPPVLEQIKVFVGDLARPVSLLIMTYASAKAILMVAPKITDGNEAAFFAGTLLAGVGVLYGAKSLENFGIAKTTAKTAQVQAQTGATT